MTEDRKPGPEEDPDTERPVWRRSAVVLGVLGAAAVLSVAVMFHFHRQARDPMMLDAALRIAISGCDEEGVRAALALGANPNLSPLEPDTTADRAHPGQDSRPVQAYVSCPDPGVLQVMKDAGADLTPDLRRLADRAMRPPQPQVMAWLLANGLSPQSRWPNAEGWETLCHRAARRAQPEVLRAVLDAGADPNARDSAGLTPLGRVNHIIARARTRMADPGPTDSADPQAPDPAQRFADVIAVLHEAGGTE